jgi:hypothetical protein
MQTTKFKRLAEDILSEHPYRADLDVLADRQRFAAIIDFYIKDVGQIFKNDYTRDYSEYRVTQVLGLKELNRFTQMCGNEICAWAKALDVPRKELVEAGAGIEALTVHQLNALIREEGAYLVITESAA